MGVWLAILGHDDPLVDSNPFYLVCHGQLQHVLMIKAVAFKTRLALNGFTRTNASSRANLEQ